MTQLERYRELLTHGMEFMKQHTYNSGWLEASKELLAESGDHMAMSWKEVSENLEIELKHAMQEIANIKKLLDLEKKTNTDLAAKLDAANQIRVKWESEKDLLEKELARVHAELALAYQGVDEWCPEGPSRFIHLQKRNDILVDTVVALVQSCLQMNDKIVEVQIGK